MEGVLSVTPVFRPIRRTGSVTSQGDSLLRASDVRDPEQFPPSGYDGSGITVGVLSDSVNRVGAGLAASIATGDLPGPVNPLGNTAPVEVLQEFRGEPPGRRKPRSCTNLRTPAATARPIASSSNGIRFLTGPKFPIRRRFRRFCN